MKTYKIVDATIEHPTAGTIVKENIVYYIDGVETDKESYSKNGVVFGTIREGYSNDSDDLDNRKEQKINSIDAKTQEIINRGFVFGGKTFSLSDNAQRNWIGIAAGLGAGIYTIANFPFPLSDTSNKKYMLQWTDRFTFLGQVSYTIGFNKTLGTVLKQQVLDATTQSELDLIIDTRL